MPSTPTMKEADPHDPVLIDPEVVLAARADRAASATGAESARRPADRPAPVITRPGPTAMPAPTPMVDPEFRTASAATASATGRRAPIATWAVRTGLAVLFAVLSAVAAAAWQTYGDRAQEVVARWMPRISFLMPSDNKEPSAAQPAAQPATAEDQAAWSTAAATPAQTAATAGTIPTSAQDPAPSSAQLLQSMAHDLAAMGQQIADLKASVAQLKAGQDQMVQQMAARASEPRAERAADAKPFDPRAIEQTLRPRPAPRPATTAPAVATTAPVHRPRPVYPATQTIGAPSQAPMPLPSAPPPQTTGDPGAESVVRPPMPVR
ncbi:MAG: hypothetical protein ABW175_04705 [Bradyrhizobium sp.]